MKTPTTRFTECGGFNVTELLATCAILSVVAAAAVPQMLTGLDRMRLGMTLRDVDRELQFARLKAVATSQPMRVRLNCPAAGQIRAVEVIGTATNPDPNDADTVVTRCNETTYPYRPTGADTNRLTRPNNDGPIVRLYQGTTIVGQTLEFWGDGTVHTPCQAQCNPITPVTQIGTATITVTRKGVSKNITVNGLGKIQSDR